jgi:hypothetical protein
LELSSIDVCDAVELERVAARYESASAMINAGDAPPLDANNTVLIPRTFDFYCKRRAMICAY